MTDYFSFMIANGMGWMMSGMVVISIVVLVALVLGIAALIKYLQA